MKYTYVYKSGDGIRHEASIEAKCREAVFETLRSRGIRAIKVIAADGSKANGESRSVSRKAFFIAITLVALVGSAIVYCANLFIGRSSWEVVRVDSARHELQPAYPLARQEILGARTRVEKLPPHFFGSWVKSEKIAA